MDAAEESRFGPYEYSALDARIDRDTRREPCPDSTCGAEAGEACGARGDVEVFCRARLLKVADRIRAARDVLGESTP